MSRGLAVFDVMARGDRAPGWVADRIRNAWALADAEVTLIVLSENVTFKVQVGERPVMVVRLSRPGYGGGHQHLASELAWMTALKRDVGAPIPVPVPAADGRVVQEVISPEENEEWLAVAFEWVEGEILEDRSDAVEYYVELGGLTAKFHDHVSSWTEPSGFTRFDWAIDDMVGSSARWGDWRAAPLSIAERATLAAAESAARDVIEATIGKDCPFPQDHWGLIHADLRPTNVMATSDGMAVIDFDDAGYSFLLYDFAAAITFMEHRPVAKSMAVAWMEGYQRIRPLTASQCDAAVALSLIRRLTMLGWQQTHREDALPADLWAENLPGTVAVAEAFLADPRWLLR